jgi:glycerol-3-phosphate dehydrogenase
MTANLHTATVGFIGLGDQGAPMAHAIGDNGFGLHVWARRPQSLDVLAQTRHTVHDSLPAWRQPSTSWSCACATTATSGRSWGPRASKTPCALA